MTMDAKTPAKISVDAVTGLIADAMERCGLPPADAVKVARLMVEADLTGADAHGVFRLPQYVGRLKLGAINRTPDIKVNRTAAATALVDGDNGMGHLVVSRAMETAIEMAREAGVAWVGIRMSNHAGAAGVYAAMALEADMIGMYSAVASANHMPVAGGAEPLLGTNPLAIAVPAGREAPVVLDIATSVVSYGTIKNHRLKDEPLAPGWMVDPATGAPITDPAKSMDGLLLPLGGYKGAGLALMLGLLGGTLNRAPFGRDVVDFNAHPEALTNTGQFVVALDVSRFQPFAEFAAEVDRQVADLRASKPLPGHDAVRLPGEQRARRRAERVRDGLPLAAELVAQLDKVAGELGIRTLGAR
jgi:LDH2 family malate/lactate/ureidoglycolate dehydrogenase